MFGGGIEREGCAGLQGEGWANRIAGRRTENILVAFIDV